VQSSVVSVMETFGKHGHDIGTVQTRRLCAVGPTICLTHERDTGYAGGTAQDIQDPPGGRMEAKRPPLRASHRVARER